jgi:hypothetical protein
MLLCLLGRNSCGSRMVNSGSHASGCRINNAGVRTYRQWSIVWISLLAVIGMTAVEITSVTNAFNLQRGVVSSMLPIFTSIGYVVVIVEAYYRIRYENLRIDNSYIRFMSPRWRWTSGGPGRVIWIPRLDIKALDLRVTGCCRISLFITVADGQELRVSGVISEYGLVDSPSKQPNAVLEEIREVLFDEE